MSSQLVFNLRLILQTRPWRSKWKRWASWENNCRDTGARAVLRSRSSAQARLSSGLTRSLAQGPSDPPLIPHTIPDNFAKIVSQYGDRPAVIAREATPHAGSGRPAKETTLTYAALDAESNRLAHALRTLGVAKGDRVAVSLGNTVGHATLTYALFKLGAILVPLNPAFNASQIGAALSHLGVEVLIVGAVTDRAYKPGQGRSNLELLKSLVPDLTARRIESAQVPSLKKIVVLDNTEYHPAVDFQLSKFPSLTRYSSLTGASSLSSTRSVVPDAPLHPDDTINIQFTSGTTSHPKAAMLSHTNILNNGHLIGHRMGLTPSDLVCCPPPLFHCFGCILGYMATVTSGAAILFPSPAFDPMANLRMALDHRATGLYGVATMFVSMLELLDKSDGPTANFTPAEIDQLPTHLQKGIAAGSSVPESLMRKLYDKLGLRELVICYGMTETSPVSCMTAPTDPLDKRIGSIGRVMPHTRVKIVDPVDRTKIVPIGERGELATSGYLVMQGYWGDEAHTAEVRSHEPDVDAGPPAPNNSNSRWWMYSGDEATMSADGYVSITGRIKDLIIRGGENIHPLEIENALFQHPLIAEASVVGVPDARLGEAVCAFIVARAGVATEDDPTSGEDGFAPRSESQGMPLLRKDDVRAWVRGRLSAHLVPRYIFWTDDYPKTASGKIQKFKLREAAGELIEIYTGKGDVEERFDKVLD
ncbi:unnamed protein product [Discula destructiva]